MESWDELNQTETKKEVKFGAAVCELTNYNLCIYIPIYNHRLPTTISESWYTFSNMHMQHMVGKAIAQQECVRLVVSWERDANSKHVQYTYMQLYVYMYTSLICKLLYRVQNKEWTVHGQMAEYFNKCLAIYKSI